MNRNIAIVLLIFLVPLAVYWGVTRDKSLGTLPGIAFAGPEIIKFSSPMCYEVYPAYSGKVGLRKVDVTQQDVETKKLIKEYQVKLVPTCVFKNAEGAVTRRTEGAMQPRILENYIKEQLNG